MVNETLSFRISDIKDVDNLASMLKNTLPKMGYKPVPSPGVISKNRGIYLRTIHFERGDSGCYCEFDLDQEIYNTSIKFKNFPEKHYDVISDALSRKYPQFFLEYAEK
ncbi:MAG: hypothetical protein KJ767_00835 [Nanoarchaeota archaeon]|nr:hypothetical protein [Nanoarchaeota archaeon]